MKLLIDTNILLDVLMQRKEFVDDSLKIWKLCEISAVEGHISALSFANLVYIMRKILSAKEIEIILNKLQLIFQIEELSSLTLTKAAQMHFDDFEDAIQCATAMQIKADFMITRNIKDDVFGNIRAITPSEFLENN